MLSLILLFATLSGDLIQRASSVAPHRSNPLPANKETVAAGEKLFRRNCAYCHGENGIGNGRKKTPPLTIPTVKHADPGTLFWVLQNGSENGSMPSFAHLPDAEKWQIIAFLQRR